MQPREIVDLTGCVFGRLTVLHRVPRDGHRSKKFTGTMWKVQCSCGVEKSVAGLSLRKGHTLSCGCLRDERTGAACKRRGGDKHWNWNGGRSVSKKGYARIARSVVEVIYPDAIIRKYHGDVFEHIAAMSHHLKRAMLPGETIHHKNGIRTDNAIGNLELRVGNHGPGQAVDDVVKWATEVLSRYAPDRLAVHAIAS